MYASAMNSKERENLLENERTMIASKLAELSEEQSKKMLQKEIRLREDAQSKFVLLEKVCKPMFSTIPHFGNDKGSGAKVCSAIYCFWDHYCLGMLRLSAFSQFFPLSLGIVINSPRIYESDKCVIKFQYSGHTLVSPMERN